MKNNVSIVGIATTYVGTVIGAGYASGQEILQYFLYFREHTFLIVCIATIFFFLFGYIPVYLANILASKDYLKVINPRNIKFFSSFSDFFITLSLFGTLVIMLAGSGATFEENFHLPLFVGALIVCILLVLNTYSGLNVIVKVMEILTPIMFLSVLFVGIYSLLNQNSYSSEEIENATINNSDLLWHWSISGILYVAFNFQLALAILVPLSYRVKNNRTMFLGVLLGSLMLGACAGFMCWVLKAHIVEIGTEKLPMNILANQMSPLMGFCYAIVIFFGLYSTAITCFYGCVERLKSLRILRRTSSLIILSITALTGFFASLLGFKDLIGIIYPLLGYGGLVIMLIILDAYFYIKRNVNARENVKKDL